MYPNPLSGPAIHHEGGGVLEEAAQHRVGFGWQADLVERACHERDPAITSRLVDDERGMTLAQPRVSARFDVPLRTAEPAYQEIAQALFRARQIGGGIHRRQHVVGWHLRVEGPDQARETVLADLRVHIDLLEHQ